MKKATFCCFLLGSIFLFISSAHSCEEYVHRLDEGKKNAIYVSKSSRHSFPQEGYTYSFPVCDKNDEKILNTLGQVFGSQSSANRTIGTYSIGIDYTDAKDSYVHRKRGYLREDDLESTEEAIPFHKNVEKKDGWILFSSKREYAPRCLDSYCFNSNALKDDRIFYNKNNTYHMENSLLSSLYNNKAFFKHIKNKIPTGKPILGICIKIYSSYEFCSDCCANICTLMPYLQTQFSATFHSSSPIPLTILGLAYRPYAIAYDPKGVQLENNYWTSLYPADQFIPFDGVIHGDSSQSILPIHLYAQPATPQGKEQTLTLN